MVHYEWAMSAATHGVSRARARHVIENAPKALPIADEDGDPDPALLLFLGDDQNGVPLEVIVRIVDDGLVRVFHVMTMRRKYRPLYKRVKT